MLNLTNIIKQNEAYNRQSHSIFLLQIGKALAGGKCGSDKTETIEMDHVQHFHFIFIYSYFEFQKTFRTCHKCIILF